LFTVEKFSNSEEICLRTLKRIITHIIPKLHCQAGDMAACVLAEYKRNAAKTLSLPRVFHFRPPGLAHLVTLVYPEQADDSVYQPLQRSWHAAFLLPADRPLFRKENAVEFADAKAKAKLLNVHTSISEKHGVPGAEVALVRGNYAYHHYMQV
jgi:hypothetical protein